MKKLMFVMMALTAFSANAFANDVCQDRDKIGSAAEKAFERSETPRYDEADLAYADKDGKDKWVVMVIVNDECEARAVVYTEAGTCKVVSKPVEIGTRDCG